MRASCLTVGRRRSLRERRPRGSVPGPGPGSLRKFSAAGREATAAAEGRIGSVAPRARMVGAPGQTPRGGRPPAVRILLDGKDRPSGGPAPGLFERHGVLRLVALPEDRLDDLVMAESPNPRGHRPLLTSTEPIVQPIGCFSARAGSKMQPRGCL